MGEEKGAGDKKDGGDKKPAGQSAFAKKMIKVFTIIAYISGVSGPGFLLSLYYIIFFDPNIQGVRPPGYLKTGEMVGLPQARIDPMPEALTGFKAPPTFDKKMSREFMEAYFRNLTHRGDRGLEEEGSLMMEEQQPTPKALPIITKQNYHHTNSHHSHHNGQSAQSNNNHQSSGPSPQQGGTARDTSPSGAPFISDDIRQHQQHGQPPIYTSA